MSNFQKKLKDIFTKYDNALKKPPPDFPDEKANKILYEIRKRSLPPKLDQKIMWNLTEKEANERMKMLKPKLMETQEDGLRVVHYYDQIQQGSLKSGIYDNDLPSLIKESPDQSPPQIIEIQLNDVTWKD